MLDMKSNYTLNNGVQIPIVGYGTFKTPNDQTGVEALIYALKAGYRHIDTAVGYRNEASVGKAVRACGIDRKEIFVTSKLTNSDHGYEATVAAIDESLKQLDMDYMDLYLIHWPNPLQFRDNWKETNAGSWKAFEEAYAAGKIKALGVSNFRVLHLEALLETATIIPTVNQIRLCPGDVHKETAEFCENHNILLEGYSPLGQGLIFGVPELEALAAKYNKQVAQISLRWSLQKGFLPLPKSVTPKRIDSNMDLFDFELEKADVDLITGLTGRCGLSKDPDTVPF